MKKDYAKFVQIIPVPVRIDAVYKQDDGTEDRSPILFAALDEEGDIKLLDFEAGGFFDDPIDCNNFLRFELVDEKEQ